ncbi:hypothetical protein [Alistipes sp.]|uniref:hypothetical protein n=1 Tax=Alistipes sp. TaxID=1872444 RepID=UPI003AF1C2B3
MNRIFLFTATLLLPALPVAAQQSDSPRTASRSDRPALKVETIDRDSAGIDTLRRIDTTDGNLIRLRDGSGNVQLEVGGFNLTLGGVGNRPSPRFTVGLITHAELGFASLAGLGYDDYPLPEQGFLDQKLTSSFHIGFSAVQVRMTLNRSRTLSIAADLQLAVDSYRLAATEHYVDWNDAAGRLVPVALGEPAERTGLFTATVGLPLRLIYEPVDKLCLSAVLYNDFGVESSSRYKNPRLVQRELTGLNVYRFGVGASVSYSGIGFFVRYSLTPLFKPHEGPVCHPMSFGLTFLM